MKSKIKLFRLNFSVVFIVLLFSMNNGFAQEAKIYELFEDGTQGTVQIDKTGLTTLAQGATTTYTEDLNNFYDLNNNLKPTVYVVNNSIVKVSGESDPLKLNSEDVQSFNLLKLSNPLYQSVELLIINLENPSELNTPLDFTTLQNFNSLKYIYVKSNFKCTVDQIKVFIQNAPPEITIYFMTVIPS